MAVTTTPVAAIQPSQNRRSFENVKKNSAGIIEWYASPTEQRAATTKIAIAERAVSWARLNQTAHTMPPTRVGGPRAKAISADTSIIVRNLSLIQQDATVRLH